ILTVAPRWCGARIDHLAGRQPRTPVISPVGITGSPSSPALLPSQWEKSVVPPLPAHRLTRGGIPDIALLATPSFPLFLLTGRGGRGVRELLGEAAGGEAALEPVPRGEGDGRGAGGDAELAQDVRDMPHRGAVADEERLADLFVGPPVDH